MARKKSKNRPPKVPRSTIKERRMGGSISRRPPTTASPAVTAASVATSTPAPPVPEGPTLAEQYAHVKKELVYISIFGTLIFAVMFGLKFMGI